MKKLFLVLCVIFTVLALFAAPKQKNTGSQKAKSSNVQNQTGNLQWSNKSPNAMGWSDAVKYCINLDEGGYNDWRLPPIDELRTLIKNCPKTETGGICRISEKNGYLAPIHGGDNNGSCWCDDRGGSYYSKLGDEDGFWSSSSGQYDIWSVNFRKGHVRRSFGIEGEGQYGTMYVRCSRDKNSKIGNLQWSKVAPKVLNLKDAILYCHRLNEAGHSDWRVPNIDELRTLIINHTNTETGGICRISEKIEYPPIWEVCHGDNHDGNFSKLGDIGWFWSSSVLPDNRRVAWRVNFSDGGLDNADIFSNGYNVRCVRER